MKALFLSLAILCGVCVALPALAGDPPPARTQALEGTWAMYLKIYHGTEYPEGPSATLRLRYEFNAEGQSHLYWWHEGEGDHCSRRGEYHVEGDRIVDTIVWVDPKNTRDCASDPDMQLGRIARTRFHFRGDDLALHIPFGEEEMLFVWKKLPPDAPPGS